MQARGPASFGGLAKKNEVLYREQFRKTELCRYHSNGGCRKGPGCPFAHGELELRSAPDLTKTALCQWWKRRRCPFRSSECPFAHGEQELRVTELYALAEEEALVAAASATATSRPPLSVSRARCDSEDHGERGFITEASSSPPRILSEDSGSEAGHDCGAGSAPSHSRAGPLGKRLAGRRRRTSSEAEAPRRLMRRVPPPPIMIGSGSGRPCLADQVEAAFSMLGGTCEQMFGCDAAMTGAMASQAAMCTQAQVALCPTPMLAGYAVAWFPTSPFGSAPATPPTTPGSGCSLESCSSALIAAVAGGTPAGTPPGAAAAMAVLAASAEAGTPPSTPPGAASSGPVSALAAGLSTPLGVAELAKALAEASPEVYED